MIIGTCMFDVLLRAGPGMDLYVWAPVNLMLAIAGVLLAAMTSIRTLLRKRSEDDEDADDCVVDEAENETENVAEDETENKTEPAKKQLAKYRPIWVLTSLVTGIAGIIVFILTENIKLPIVFMDKWTIVNAIILIAGIMSCIYVKKSTESEDAETDETNETPEDNI